MTEEKSSPPTTSANSSNPRSSISRALRFRIGFFIVIILGCAWYSGIFHSVWTTFFPRTCASGSIALFEVNFNEVPARLGSQFNACTDIGDGECQRITNGLTIRGECRQGKMQGPWSVVDSKSTRAVWKGSFCNGLPCGEFRVLVDGNHENLFQIENLHVHGSATLWEKQTRGLTQSTGEYKFGKRNGRWVRHAEPEHKIMSATIYDEIGIPSTTSYYCTNGNRKEVRGKTVFYYDAQGNGLPHEVGSENDALDAKLCPLP